MKIAFDISQTGKAKAGCGYFAAALSEFLPVIAPENRYCFLQSFGDFYFDAELSRRQATSTQNGTVGPFLYSYEAARQFWNAENLEIALGSPDIVHANNFWCPLQLKTSHLIYTLYDLSFMEQPDWTTEANRIGCLEGVFRASITADWIVAISKSSRDHFLKCFPYFPKDRLTVIYPATRFIKTDNEGRRPAALQGVAAGAFWLSVGTIEPRKNQKMLAQAYARYQSSDAAPMPLVFAGGNGWKMDDFKEYLGSLGIASHVIITGYVSDDELIWLYRNCYANLYPSFFEGFGLPVLEGMQFGAPTIASNTTSLPEVAGDAAILLPTDDLEGWAQALQQLAQHPEVRAQLVERAQGRTSHFNWENSAAMLLAVYREAMKRPKRELQ